MLYLIGVGFQPKHLNIAAQKAIKRCEKIFAENYTLDYDFETLGRIIGKGIKVLSREEVEEGDTILNEAEESDVAFLVPGDPLTATTHFSIISLAKDLDIQFKVIHNVSIFSAIGETGLHMYKFGKTTSIPFPKKGFEPTSFYDTIEQNLKIGAHTLVLLDINMPVKKGLELLMNASKGEIKPETKIIAAHISDDSQVIYGKIKDMKGTHFPDPSCLVIPAELHFTEKEVLEKLYNLV